jgi:hypothetical protein
VVRWWVLDILFKKKIKIYLKTPLKLNLLEIFRKKIIKNQLFLIKIKKTKISKKVNIYIKNNKKMKNKKNYKTGCFFFEIF